ncbi:hypothetical protein CU098_004864 [Rhizopus stolonifer]|uniref:S1 motif domain-containing protein n=1 Tax=Rhizopus stolonifer TaxID=4846 RepID=A0A367J4H8_RHIST|nr:hypothetical protein CU098_004864 [Rhizopus stolonifer]
MADNKFSCRMYENEFPKVDDVVMVNVRQIADMGAYVKLLEYGDREGMILLSELSRRRIRSVQKLIRVGKDEVVVVLRVDEEKGYIDLSKRRVTPEDIIKCEEKYKKSKQVHSILRHVAEKNDVALQTLYETIGWPLYKRFGHAYDAFKVAILDTEAIFGDMNISKELLDELLAIIKRRMTPQPVKIRAQLDIRCTGIDGVNAIKNALKAGEKVGTEDVPVKITYLAAPLYVITVDSLDKELGFEIVGKAIEAIEATLNEHSWGRFKVEKEAKLVSDSDDRDFAALLAQAEKENELVSGDEDEGDAVVASDDDIILERTSSLVISMLKREEELEDAKKEHVSSTQDQERLEAMETTFKNKITALKVEVEDLRKQEKDTENLKKQIAQQTEEYNQLLGRHEALKQKQA